jgi:cyclopropane-fatty-acyl-phospholipid synthase
MLDNLLAQNILPDSLVRYGIRRLLKQRLSEISFRDISQKDQYIHQFIKDLNQLNQIAIKTDEANQQHYEVPTEFYLHCLGARLKYSCCYYSKPDMSLDQAEEVMLKITCERAMLKDGMEVLELGCGWGSLSLYMAQNYPNSQITAISNSKTQKEFIDKKAQDQGIKNLTIVTQDMNKFETEKKFDRVVSVEMFEHMRQYSELFKKVASFLKDEGKAFVHVFVHKETPYFFDVKDESDWMSKYFFSGGVMPSDHLFYYFNQDIRISKHWRVSGTHYQKTADHWLENMDRNRAKIMPIFEKFYGKDQALKWFSYWRIFFMACSELWGYKSGNEWYVGHYLFEKVKNQ